MSFFVLYYLSEYPLKSFWEGKNAIWRRIPASLCQKSLLKSFSLNETCKTCLHVRFLDAMCVISRRLWRHAITRAWFLAVRVVICLSTLLYRLLLTNHSASYISLRHNTRRTFFFYFQHLNNLWQPQTMRTKFANKEVKRNWNRSVLKMQMKTSRSRRLGVRTVRRNCEQRILCTKYSLFSLIIPHGFIQIPVF